MRKRTKARARRLLINRAFEAYVDYAVIQLVELGCSATQALEVVFTTAQYLAEQGQMPPFPDGRVSCEVKGRWVVAAADFGFVDFVVEAVTE